ncbi:MAG: DUF4411 family protein [Sphaerochaetaceae bacterium]
MPDNELFLIDANILITPQEQYYPFDLAPNFWVQMAEKIEEGSIAILDMVKDEILVSKEKDDLATWFDNLKVGCYVNHKQQDIINKYSEVLQSIQTNPCYKEKALRAWAQEKVADPWLIAAASIFGFTLITIEKRANKPSQYNPSGNPKIPNVASDFYGKVEDLFSMMRKLQIKLA